MNKYALTVLLLVMLFLAACQEQVTPTPLPTSTPIPTPTPIPANPDVLDWHLQFSADNQIQLFRCTVLQDIDRGTVSLMNPLNVRLSAVPITAQMLEESHRILMSANPTASNVVAHLLAEPTTLIVLLRFDLVTDQDLYKPYRMLRIATTGLESNLYSLSDLRFEFSNDAFTEEIVRLQVGDTVYRASMIPDSELEIGVTYPIYFEIDGDALAMMQSGKLTLSIDAAMLVPFTIDTCQTGNYQQFILHPRIASGAANEMPNLYGSPGDNIETMVIEEFRLTLLANVLPSLNRLIVENSVEAEATTEPQETAVPESTSEVDDTSQD